MTGGAASSPEAIRQAKAALRKATLARRDAVDAATRARDSQTITQKLEALPAYRQARVVAAYASFGSEFDTTRFLATVLADGKQLLLPRINREQRVLELRHVADLERDLVPGVWGIREPGTQCAMHSPSEVGFMLVPGVAFTRTGARPGYGGGFYDRLMASLQQGAPRIAAVFSLQLVDQIPETPLDLRVDGVVTE